MLDALTKLVAVLPWWDWAALVWFFAAWIGYAEFAKRRATVQPSLLAASNRVRRQWMLQATRRDVRVVDGSPAYVVGTRVCRDRSQLINVLKQQEYMSAMGQCKELRIGLAEYLGKRDFRVKAICGHQKTGYIRGGASRWL